MLNSLGVYICMDVYIYLLEFQSLSQSTDHSSDPGDMSDMVVGMGCEGEA